VNGFIGDLRFAFRMLVKSPGFTVVIVLTLALAIGANTAIFSVVDAVLIRALPFRQPDRLVLLWGTVMRTHWERRGASLPDFVDWRNQSRSFDGMAAWWDTNVTLLGMEQPERIDSEIVSPGYFSLLGVESMLGRSFRANEDLGSSAPPVAVLSYGLWVRQFGADPSVIGKTINLDQHMHTIVGVMPAGFRGLSDHSELWIPLSSVPELNEAAGERGSRWFPALARLKPGVSMAQAQAEMDTLSKSLERSYPDTNEKRGVEIVSLSSETVGSIRPALLVILAAVGFVLLIACANVANLLLAKAESRRREIAIRAAIGATRGRLLRQLVTESLVLSFLGGAVGALFSAWGVKALMLLSPVTFPSFADPRVDMRIALFTVLLSLGTGIGVGLAPAVSASTGRLHDALKQSSGGSGAGHRPYHGILVIAEMATVLVLLIGASLLIRSYRALSSLNPGFQADHLLTLRISLPRMVPPPDKPASRLNGQADQSPTPPDMQTVTSGRIVIERLRSLPGVQSVALGTDIPLSGDASAVFYTAEGQPPVTAQNVPRAYVHRVTSGFFTTLGIPILYGRDFLSTDTDGVVIVSDNVVRRFWPGQDPIGKRVKPGRVDSKSPWRTIVGVVAEVKYRGLPKNPTGDPDLYFPFAERARTFALFVRVGTDPSLLVAPLRSELHDIDSAMTIYDVTPMLKRIAGQTALSRFAGRLTGIFSVVALFLATIGIYGVMACTVTRRSREFGVRMALGAETKDVLRLVLGHGLALTLIGLAIGVLAALGLTQLIANLLFGVRPTDPATFTGVAILLVVDALAACYIPARRATRVNPLVALRYE
jgi:putative ABC transport system permease protein